MNQVQRKYLISQIEEQIKASVNILESSKPDAPSLDNYLFKAILTEGVKLQPEEHILGVLKKKALNAKDGRNWLSDNHSWGDIERVVKINISDLLVLPEDYKEKLDEYRDSVEKIRKAVSEIRTNGQSLITRIQLASDKVLEKMIAEVDDMGDISLMDTKLRLLSDPVANKLLNDGGNKD